MMKRGPDTNNPTFENREVDYRSLFENSGVGIFRLDAHGQRFVTANPAMARILGYTSPEEIRETVVPVIEKLFVDSRDGERFLHSREDDTRWEVEVQVCRKDGSKRWVMMTVIGSKEDGRAYHDGVLYDITERKQAQSSLKRLSARLLRLQDEERRRLARELHDSTGQDLAALEMDLVHLENSVRESLPETEQSTLSDSLKLARKCSQQIRTMSYLLHPPLLDELGLDVAIRDYVDGFSQRAEIPVHVEVSSNLGRLRPEVETALFRIVQECLGNVQRHSGSPDAELRLVAGDEEVRLEVSDRGRGIAPSALSDDEEDGVAHLGVGIRGMRERMHELGGRLSIDSGPGGTTVSAVLPVSAARSAT